MKINSISFKGVSIAKNLKTKTQQELASNLKNIMISTGLSDFYEQNGKDMLIINGNTNTSVTISLKNKRPWNILNN